MRIVKPKYEIVQQAPGYDGMLRHIEIAGRTCYKSEKMITDDSAAQFVKRLVMSGHLAMVEHGTVYLTMPMDNMWYTRFDANPYSIVNIDHKKDTLCITTNFRVLIENEWSNLIEQYMTEPTNQHERRVTVRFYTQIAVSREYNRHRANSIAESSTRYCNYTKEKFGGEVAINKPSFVNMEGHRYPEFQDYINEMYLQYESQWDVIDWWLFANLACEKAYESLVKLGWTAQQARTVLPLDTNTELIHTAFVSDWKHFFDLRADGKTGAPHPDASWLAIPLKEDFQSLNII